MSVQGSAPRKLFDVELPARVGDMLRLVETRIRQTVTELRGSDKADVSSVVGYFDDTGKPFIAYREKKGPPPLELLCLEIARLWFRNGKFEKNMPYAEMRHPANQRLCRRLYRILEGEIIVSDVASLGLPIRKWTMEHYKTHFREALAAGKYRHGEPDPGRLREGALDALDAAIAEFDEKATQRLGIEIAEADAGIARPYGLMLKVVESHRPFDGEDRVRAAYYLAVPFLFDARKPSTPMIRGRPM